jgi:hypothetical protein
MSYLVGVGEIGDRDRHGLGAMTAADLHDRDLVAES